MGKQVRSHKGMIAESNAMAKTSNEPCPSDGPDSERVENVRKLEASVRAYEELMLRSGMDQPVTVSPHPMFWPEAELDSLLARREAMELPRRAPDQMRRIAVPRQFVARKLSVSALPGCLILAQALTESIVNAAYLHVWVDGSNIILLPRQDARAIGDFLVSCDGIRRPNWSGVEQPQKPICATLVDGTHVEVRCRWRADAYYAAELAEVASHRALKCSGWNSERGLSDLPVRDEALAALLGTTYRERAESVAKAIEVLREARSTAYRWIETVLISTPALSDLRSEVEVALGRKIRRRRTTT